MSDRHPGNVGLVQQDIHIHFVRENAAGRGQAVDADYCGHGGYTPVLEDTPSLEEAALGVEVDVRTDQLVTLEPLAGVGVDKIEAWEGFASKQLLGAEGPMND